MVDDGLETIVAGIHAIGECAEHRGICYGLVEPAYEQARVLAERLAGSDVALCRQRARDQPEGLRRQRVLGRRLPRRAGTEEIVLSDPGLHSYKKLVIADGRLVGAVLFGDTADGLWYLDLIRSRRVDRAASRNDLMFGRALVERTAA